MNESFTASSLRGEILKILYVQGATQEENKLNSFFLWGALHEWGNADNGRPLERETIEGMVDELAGRGFVDKNMIGPMTHLPTDFEVGLTARGRILIEGTLPEEPDIRISDIET